MAMIYHKTEIEIIDGRKYATIRRWDGEYVLRIPVKSLPEGYTMAGRCSDIEKCSCKFRPWCTRLWSPVQVPEDRVDRWLWEGWPDWCSSDLDDLKCEPDLTEKEAETLYKILAGKVRKKWKYDEKKR